MNFSDMILCSDCQIDCHHHHLDPNIAPGPCDCLNFLCQPENMVFKNDR